MLLKVAAARSPGPAGLVDRFLAQLSSPAFVLALVTYVALLLVWTWILGFVPLNRAYPFVGLSFIWTAMAGAVFFDERLSAGNVAGLALIVCGVVLATR